MQKKYVHMNISQKICHQTQHLERLQIFFLTLNLKRKLLLYFGTILSNHHWMIYLCHWAAGQAHISLHILAGLDRRACSVKLKNLSLGRLIKKSNSC